MCEGGGCVFINDGGMGGTCAKAGPNPGVF